MVGITGIMPDDDDEGSPRVVGGLDKTVACTRSLMDSSLMLHTPMEEEKHGS